MIVDPKNDAQLLSTLGYAQELKRCMKGFSNFSISFSIICILAGGLTSFQLAFSVAGGAGIGLGWLAGGAFSLLVSASMAQIASAYPTAGGLYHWSTILGGRCWGWMNAWVNLLGLIFVVASVNVGVYLLAKNFIFHDILQWPTETWGVAAQIAGVALICFSQALLNHFGLRLAMKFIDFSGVFIFVVAVVLTVLMLSHFHHPLDLQRLFHFENFTGPAGGDIVPRTGNSTIVFCLSLLLPLYTVTGFDGSAHASEETINAQAAVPKAMMGAVFWSVLLGYVMVCSFVLALDDPSLAAKRGDQAVFQLLGGLPIARWLRQIVGVCIVLANYLCGLACVMSTSRLIFAFARDGGLPKLLRHLNRNTQSPTAAVWAAAVLSILATLYSPAFQALAAGCAVFLYVAYAMPIAAGFVAQRKGWRDFGPFRLGRLSGPFSILTVAGVVFVTYLGLWSNTILRSYALGLLVLLLCIWFIYARKRFAGPQIARAAPVRVSV